MAARALVLGLALLVSGAGVVAEPGGFRGPPYRDAVPETVLGARGITTAEAVALHAQGVPFIDVLPHTARPEGLPEGTIWRTPLHLTIPDAHWLPGAGYEALAPETEAWVRAALDRLTGGDPDATVVFFCKRDCWMSWNATRRAQLWGYSGALWFPDGQDGWPEPLAEVTPEPGAS